MLPAFRCIVTGWRPQNHRFFGCPVSFKHLRLSTIANETANVKPPNPLNNGDWLNCPLIAPLRLVKFRRRIEVFDATPNAGKLFCAWVYELQSTEGSAILSP